MTLKEFERYALEYYRRKPWLPSLTPTPENIKKAYDAYRHGILGRLPRITAVTLVYGYRYRRLETFLEEIRIYEPVLRQWYHNLSLVKLKALYVSRKKGREMVDFELLAPRPLCEVKLDKRVLDHIFYTCLGLTPFALLSAEIKIVREYHFQDVGETFIPYYECYYDCHAVLTILFPDKQYAYQYSWTDENPISIINYAVFGVKTECRGDIIKDFPDPVESRLEPKAEAWEYVVKKWVDEGVSI